MFVKIVCWFGVCLILGLSVSWWVVILVLGLSVSWLVVMFDICFVCLLVGD